MGKIEDRRAITPLIEAFTDKGVAKYASYALAGRIGSDSVIKLVDTRRGNNPLLREKAAIVLGNMEKQNSTTVLPLLEAACDSNKELAWCARYALKEIGDEIIIKSVTDIGEPAVDIVSKCIRLNDFQVFRPALHALQQINPERAVLPLTTLLQKIFPHFPSPLIVDALEKLKWKPENDEIGLYYWIIKSA